MAQVANRSIVDAPVLEVFEIGLDGAWSKQVYWEVFLPMGQGVKVGDQIILWFYDFVGIL